MLIKNTMKRKVYQTLLIIMTSLSLNSAWADEAASVADQLRADNNLRLFANALEHSGLMRLLETGESITVFAPTDTAMHAEGSAFLLGEVLLTESNQSRLEDKLKQHIVPAQLALTDQASQTGILKVQTLADTCLRIERSAEAQRVGPEAVVTGRRQAKNGTIYLIDRLLWAPYDQAIQSNPCDYPMVSTK